ncbi:MAG: helical backbone metal receptor [bacterium]
MRKTSLKQCGAPWLLLIAIAWWLPRPGFAYSRIVSLKPNLTEILFALGAGPQVVGVTQWCKRPEEAKKLPKVADYVKAFPEEILRLQPDLVLGTVENGSQKEVQFLIDRGVTVLTLGSREDSSPREVERLKSLGFDIAALGFGTLEQTMRSIEALGALLERREAARAMTAKMAAELAELRAAAAPLPKTKVLYVVGYQPLVVAGGGNFFDEAGPYVGAENVARQSRLKYPYYTTELLIRSAPEVILDFAMGSENSPAARQGREDFWRQFPSIPAVKNGRVYELDIEKMRAVPSLPETFKEIFQLLHPRGT